MVHRKPTDLGRNLGFFYNTSNMKVKYQYMLGKYGILLITSITENNDHC
jgi:hypothetical protein